MEVEIGGTWPQVKQCQESPNAGGKKDKILPSSLQRKHGHVEILLLNIWPLEP